MEETFDQLPLYLDPKTKEISAPSSKSSALEAELALLNATHKALQQSDIQHNVPPPPLPLNPKRSAAIAKMREQATAAIKKHTTGPGPMQDAVRYYTFALDMALQRPMWEPSQIVKDETSVLYSNRAQAHIGLQNWPEGAVDAETSVELKPAPAQAKAWWRRGKCLFEMDRLDEAKEWVARALEFETGDGAAELKSLKGQIDEKLARRKN